MDHSTRIDIIFEALSELSGEQVLRYFLGWHGTQLLDEGFYQYLIDEGVLPEEEEEDEGGAS
jgi:hypothetical protein